MVACDGIALYSLRHIAMQTDEGSAAAKPMVPLVAVSGSLFLGGSSTFLVNLSRAFARRGLSLPVVCLDGNNEHASDFVRIGNPVHCISRSKLIYEDRLLAAYRSVAQYAPRAVLSCLGAESFEVLRLVPPGVARLGVIQSHDPGPYKTAQVYAPYLDAMVGVSRVIKQELASMPDLARTRVKCIPYGIAFTDPAPTHAPEPERPLRIIYLGRLVEEQKRVSRLVALAQMLDERKIDVEFTIAGTGSEEARLREALKGLGWVHFTGVVANDRTAELLRAHDIFILLSDYEGLPLSLLEAMGQGVVPLVSDLASGLRDIVSDSCGFRVPVGDVSAACDIITRLASDRAALSTRSRESAAIAREQYSADRMAAHYLDLIAALGKASPAWPEHRDIPVPLGLRPWLYSGLMRHVRRSLKMIMRRRC